MMEFFAINRLTLYGRQTKNTIWNALEAIQTYNVYENAGQMESKCTKLCNKYGIAKKSL